MKRKILTAVIFAIIFPLLSLSKEQAKYVFYFIGDGMGVNHVYATEYYKAYIGGFHGSEPLSFSKFPILGSATSFSESNLITDSSAAGTALSSGEKTKNGMLGITADSTIKLTSIAEKIHAAGYKVGISSTVGINHATPGAFYGHNINRGNYYEIGQEICHTGFEFFGGGGILDHNGKKKDKPSIYGMMEKAGYKIIEGMEEYEECENIEEKIYLIQKDGKEKDNLPFAIDATCNDMTHADIVKAAVSHLYNKNSKGFFLMSESGKIDWSSHGNDFMTTIMEVMSLSDAVEVALEFYRQHPDETLIIVTADHETGGLSLGYQKGYVIDFKHLDGINRSKDKYSDIEKEDIDKATNKAGISWSTSSHSASNVPVYAIGANSGLFSGRMDNTDIPKRICEAMNIEF